MRIGLLMGRSFTDERNMPEIARLLAHRGATAHPLRLGDDLIDVARVRLDYDLYVLRNRTDLAMSVAADLHGAGAAVLNPYPVSALLRDRIVTLRVLRADRRGAGHAADRAPGPLPGFIGRPVGCSFPLASS